MRKTKEDLFKEITPIEYAGMFRKEEVNKRLKNWSINGLEKLKELWHKHYTTSAHRLICAVPMTISERDTDFENLEKALIDSSSSKFIDLDKRDE